MIYSVRLYTVDLVHMPAFLAAFQRGGLWTDIARLQPGHIHTDLLRNPSDSSKFLSIEFWTSIQALVAARRSPGVRSFVGWLDRQAIAHEGLGMFVFPPRSNTDFTPDEVPSTACSIPGGARGELFPLFAFDQKRGLQIFEAIPQILQIFGDRLSRWAIAGWFIAACSYLDDQSLEDLVEEDPAWVISAARDEMDEVSHG